jgi:hypothetical protein
MVTPLNTRMGTIKAFSLEEGQVKYLFQHDPRFDTTIPDTWLLESEFEECKRPSNGEVEAINNLMKHKS